MKKMTIYLHSKIQIAAVDPQVFGGFLEHMGRAVYEDIFEPGSIHAGIEPNTLIEPESPIHANRFCIAG